MRRQVASITDAPASTLYLKSSLQSVCSGGKCANLQFLATSWWIWTPLAEAQAPDAPGEEARDKKPGRRPSILPFLPPSPPSLLVVGQQHIRVRSDGRRSVQPCEGCQGYYGDVYWGRGISQLAMILFYTFYSAFDVQGC